MKPVLRFGPLSFTGLVVLVLSGVAAYAAELNHTTNLIDQDWPVPSALPPSSDQPQFAKVIDDLPLMAGLTLEQDDDVLFLTSREGRIAETEAMGAVDIDDVYRFYYRTLPQMGWKKIDSRHFSRDGEMLRIDARSDDKQTRVLFSVTPLEK